ncbi:hypothetical protein [Pseudobdellovibrio sp. HCB154]|uniref:hypothetical protein n=1 Tax=Pseudobdellovibrio sp. HCB154 TaxID=3386277 RepID=UPI00391755B1
MKKILATSILFTLFVTASGCGHMSGHKHDHSSGAACACDKAGAKCACGTEAKAASTEKCTECAGK